VSNKILIVDDEKGIVATLEDYFETQGYQVYCGKRLFIVYHHQSKHKMNHCHKGMEIPYHHRGSIEYLQMERRYPAMLGYCYYYFIFSY